MRATCNTHVHYRTQARTRRLCADCHLNRSRPSCEELLCVQAVWASEVEPPSPARPAVSFARKQSLRASTHADIRAQKQAHESSSVSSRVHWDGVSSCVAKINSEHHSARVLAWRPALSACWEERGRERVLRAVAGTNATTQWARRCAVGKASLQLRPRTWRRCGACGSGSTLSRRSCMRLADDVSSASPAWRKFQRQRRNNISRGDAN